MADEVTIMDVLERIEKSGDEQHSAIINRLDRLNGSIERMNGRVRAVEVRQERLETQIKAWSGPAYVVAAIFSAAAAWFGRQK